MEPQRKTTELLMEYFPEELALLTEEYILPDDDRTSGESDEEHSTNLRLFSGMFGHWECAMSTTNVDELSYSLFGAIIDGDRHMAHTLISHGADLNKTLEIAASNACLYTCEILINLGATKVIHILNNGAMTDNMEMIAFAIQHGAVPDRDTMSYAGMDSSWGIILLIHNLGIKYGPAMVSSIYNGRLDILEKFIIVGAIDDKYARLLFSALCKSADKKIDHYLCMAALLEFDIESCRGCERSIAEHKREMNDHFPYDEIMQ